MTNSGKTRVDSGSQRENNGFFARLADGGFHRIIYGYDLYLALVVAIAVMLIEWKTTLQLVSLDFVKNAVPLAISLIAFILVGVSVVVSFSEEKFLALLNDLGIYDTILFNFEYTIYLAIITAVAGIVFTSYQDLLVELGIVTECYLIFVFLFVYMVLSVSNIVALIVSIGSRKARIASKR